ncbi:hypothetical protein [Virgibacillus senegalensis]|uniref:hypothetical protein n=1 Tax=Virgibacillus senegalensis TaxID=1499679 RepID=UPI00069FEBCE|nr:hypothetical protein [Virgibacillus senegalensis]
MTMLGWIFWGIIALVLLIAIILNLKFKMKSPAQDKSVPQIQAEERARSHFDKLPPVGFGG